ncbi:hypothetical protein ILUMI_20131 [Ignelater luminosus]|uniref:Mutator-like transposase domain-containing protein n=1 Tax=Ignelater luminosus TaxID=2038154 RepID=A0A8K0CHZ5_IGNLU|nr:hypothetical protein ILUMI_20131 [Ignelater luminosus]
MPMQIFSNRHRQVNSMVLQQCTGEKETVSPTKQQNSFTNVDDMQTAPEPVWFNNQIESEDVFTSNPALNNERDVKNTQKSVVLEGHRSVDFQYFFNSLKLMSAHGQKYSCNLESIEVISEEKNGLQLTFKFKCNMCCKEFKIPATETNENLLNINSATVEGITSIGGGYYNLEECV